MIPRRLIDLVDEIVAFSKSLRRRLEHKMDATRHRTARGRALFLDVAAQMAAAGPGAGALGPMAAAEPVAEALIPGEPETEGGESNVDDGNGRPTVHWRTGNGSTGGRCGVRPRYRNRRAAEGQ